MSVTIIVEDGTGLANSNSYVSASDATAYWSARQNAAWAAATSDEVNGALLVATQYIDLYYTFQGNQLTDTQALQFPRDEFDPLPQAVINATCEAALRALSAPIIADVDTSFATSVQVDVIKQTFIRVSSQVQIAIVTLLLSPFTENISAYTFRFDRA